MRYGYVLAATAFLALATFADDGLTLSAAVGPALNSDAQWVGYVDIASKGSPFNLLERSTGTKVTCTQSGGLDSSISLSADGRWAAIASPVNGVKQVFLLDRQTPGNPLLLSVEASGKPGALTSVSPSISADGRLVAFVSMSSLLTGEKVMGWSIYVWDANTKNLTCIPVASEGRQFGGGASKSSQDSFSETREGPGFRVSVSGGASGSAGGGGTSSGSTQIGAPAVSLSGDGAYIAYSMSGKVWLVNRETGESRTISPPMGIASSPATNRDGRFTAYVFGTDAYVYDRETGETKNVTHPGAAVATGPVRLPNAAGSQSGGSHSDNHISINRAPNSISVSGSASSSSSSSAHSSSQNSASGKDAGGGTPRVAISADGSVVAFDGGKKQTILVGDWQNGELVQVAEGSQVALSGDGKWVAYVTKKNEVMVVKR